MEAARREAETRGGVLEVLFVVCHACVGGRSSFFDLVVCRIRTFNVVIRSTYLQMSSIRGTSMSGNSDTKVCRHSKNHVVKIGLSGQNLATFRLVADMSPTLPTKSLLIHDNVCRLTHSAIG
jgi:hypothetical protein